MTPTPQTQNKTQNTSTYDFSDKTIFIPQPKIRKYEIVLGKVKILKPLKLDEWITELKMHIANLRDAPVGTIKYIDPSENHEEIRDYGPDTTQILVIETYNVKYDVITYLPPLSDPDEIIAEPGDEFEISLVPVEVYK
ncbi:MAG: hypothetical protein GXO43_05945 [Crenarchaeota archaeon]|nr:hypothetical protein [Thermoproteota archaeon]